MIDAYFDRGQKKLRFSAEVADHSPRIRKHLAEQFDAWSRYFESRIAEAQEQGMIGDRFLAALLARFLLNSWEGALLRMRAEKSDAPLLEFREIVFGQLLASE